MECSGKSALIRQFPTHKIADSLPYQVENASSIIVARSKTFLMALCFHALSSARDLPLLNANVLCDVPKGAHLGT